MNHKLYSSIDINQFIVQSNQDMGLKKVGNDLLVRSGRRQTNSSGINR